MVARIFSDVGGYHICNDADDCITTEAYPADTKAEALRRAYAAGYTHATGSGCPWQGIKTIPARYRTDPSAHQESVWRTEEERAYLEGEI